MWNIDFNTRAHSIAVPVMTLGRPRPSAGPGCTPASCEPFIGRCTCFSPSPILSGGGRALGRMQNSATTPLFKGLSTGAEPLQAGQRGAPDHPAVEKGLISSSPQSSKSLILRVATARPLVLAIAAIWPSKLLIGRPSSLRCPRISP